MSRVLGIVAAATLLAPSGCSEACPDGWDYDDAARICAPPEAVTAAAERALGTGIYGYATSCTDNSDGEASCHCTVDELADGGTAVMVVGSLDAAGELVPASRLSIPIRADSTYEAELVPGYAYQLEYMVRAGKRLDGAPLKTIILAEGQVEFLRLFANEACAKLGSICDYDEATRVCRES